MEEKVFNVEGMSCAHCVARVEKAVKSVGAEGKVDLAAKTVTVKGGDDAEIIRAINEAGYKAERA